MEEYLVINKKWFESQIREMGSDSDILKDPILLNKLSVYLNILTNSKPLQPILEDTFYAGAEFGDSSKAPDFETFIDNLFK